jgi:hypothetical protein
MKDPRNGSLKFTIFDLPKTIEHAQKVPFFEPCDIARSDLLVADLEFTAI